MALTKTETANIVGYSLTGVAFGLWVFMACSCITVSSLIESKRKAR